MQVKHALLALALLTTAACKTKTSEHNHADHAHTAETPATGPVASLEQQVMAVHDSAMNQMSDIMRLKKQVTAKATQTTEQTAKTKGETIARQLGEADRAMMDWMHQYNADTLGKLGQEKAADYLRDQQTKVNAVHDQMRRRIAEANTYLEQKP